MLSTKLKYLLRVPVCTVATTSSPYSIKSKKGSFDITFKTSTHKLDAQPKAPIFISVCFPRSCSTAPSKEGF